MGVSPLMSLGVKAMAANYAALQTTGHNIANANVAGYSRQQAQMATSAGQFTGAGFFGRGVDVTSVLRSHSELLVRESAGARSMAAMDSRRMEQLSRLEGIFKPGEQGLGYATSQFFNAMVDLSTQPTDGSARQVVLARADELAQRFNQAGRAAQELQAGVSNELRAAVAQVNVLSEGIAQINQRIAAVNGTGQAPNDLLDERERLISRLSEHLKVTRIDASDGTVGIFVGGGQRLVLGSNASPLKLLRDPADPARAMIGMSEGSIERVLDPASLGGGGLAGLLQFQNVDLVDGRNLLGRLAAAVGHAINQQQRLGVSLNMAAAPPGAAPDIFDLGPQSGAALANAANQRDVNGQPIGSVSFSIVDASALQASDYELRENNANPGTYELTRLRDKFTVTVSDGDVVDGVQISLGSPGPQSGDRFLLQPVGGSAVAMRRSIEDPRDLAAAAAMSLPGPTPSPADLATNNGNALAFLLLRDKALVDGMTVTDAYAQSMSDVAVRVQSARSTAEISQATAAQADLAQSSVSGVNLDEEAARLIQFQQSYQAAAKMLQVAQSLFDTLLDAARR